MSKKTKKIFAIFISLLISISHSQLRISANDQIIPNNINKKNSKLNKIKKYATRLTVGYASSNILVRALTKIAVFPAAFQNIDKNKNFENNNNNNNKILSEEIIENINKKPVVIGKKYWCNSSQDSSQDFNLKNINIIFFNGNGGSVLNDNMHLGPDGKLIYLIKQGATVYTIDYTGYGNRKKFLGSFSMSENTIFKDGEDIFNYVLNKTKNKEKIMLYGYSLGGQAAMHTWNYAQKNNLENKLAGVILHSPLNKFKKVVKKISNILEYLLNLMLINLNFDEFDKLGPTEIPSYWYSGYTEDSSEFVDLKTTICGDSNYDKSKNEAIKMVKNKLQSKGIKNAYVVMNKVSHIGNYNINSQNKEEQYEINEFKKFINKIQNNNI